MYVSPAHASPCTVTPTFAARSRPCPARLSPPQRRVPPGQGHARLGCTGAAAGGGGGGGAIPSLWRQQATLAYIPLVTSLPVTPSLPAGSPHEGRRRNSHHYSPLKHLWLCLHGPDLITMGHAAARKAPAGCWCPQDLAGPPQRHALPGPATPT